MHTTHSNTQLQLWDKPTDDAHLDYWVYWQFSGWHCCARCQDRSLPDSPEDVMKGRINHSSYTDSSWLWVWCQCLSVEILYQLQQKRWHPCTRNGFSKSHPIHRVESRLYVNVAYATCRGRLNALTIVLTYCKRFVNYCQHKLTRGWYLPRDALWRI